MLITSVKDYAIIMIDVHGAVASWNSGAEAIIGYTSEEIIGRSIDTFYTAQEIREGMPKKNLGLALQYGHFETEGWRMRKDGTLYWGNTVYTALKDEDGLLYGYSKITRDITERKNAHEGLESMMRQINQSNDAIFTTDINRKIMSWNLGAQNLYGYTKEEVLGMDTRDLFVAPYDEEA